MIHSEHVQTPPNNGRHPSAADKEPRGSAPPVKYAPIRYDTVQTLEVMETGFLDRISDAAHHNSTDIDEVMKRARMYDDASDYEHAAEWYRRAAELGDTDAQFRIGHMYSIGQGVPELEDESVKWFSIAANKGHAEAQFGLGIHYFHSKEDGHYDLAFKWLNEAYGRGITDAAYLLGQCFVYGYGTPKDPEKGISVLEVAADNTPEFTEFPEDMYDAALLIAELYDDGDLVQANEAKAVEWYRRAADAGSDEAEERLIELGIIEKRPKKGLFGRFRR